MRDEISDLCSDQPAGSPTWLLLLISELPDNSAFAASLAGGREFRGWGLDRHMRADLWDMKRAELHDAKRGKPPRYPRPGAKRAGKSLVSMSPLRRRGRHGGRGGQG